MSKNNWWEGLNKSPKMPPFWADAYPTTNGLLPYRFSFKAGSKRHTWIRYGKDLESTFDLAKKAAKREYSDASAFLIESPQRENPTWGQLHGADHQAFLAHLNKSAGHQLIREAILPKLALRRPRKRKAKKGKTNPPRDPMYQGAFKLGHEPKRTGSYVDGDTAVVESPYKRGKHLEKDYEIWVFGMIDPAMGDTWNYVAGPMEKSAAIEEAKRLAK